MHRSTVLLGLWLALVIAWAGAVHGQASKPFTGKITEIARGTQLGIGKKDTFYILRLADYPKTEFRLDHEDAVRFGVIEAAGPTSVVTPKQSKGLGWRVKLICDGNNLGLVKTPIYRVISLERLND
ncbi:MAG: hypothetical protein A2139_02990 [Desulfobacca sp. RBG_16_60_12]|nr:MAG: hypothetical protein A2139_02990 [Desulfobacca sp. RBG_16_60_12]